MHVRPSHPEPLPYLLAPAPGAETVALFGEVLFDRFPDGSAVPGGAAFNVARHLRSFGLYPVLLSRVGANEERVPALLRQFDMDPRGVQLDETHPTGEVRIDLQAREPEFDIPPRQAFDFIHAGPARAAGASVSPRLLYYGTLAQRHSTSRRALEGLQKDLNGPRLCDLNLRKPWYDAAVLRRSLQLADYLKANDMELVELSRLLRLPEETGAAGAVLLERFDLQQVVVTFGEQGARLFSRSGREARVEGARRPVSVVDTVGAGDAFAAVYILGILHDWDEALMLARADDFARAICGIRGAVPDNPNFYRPFLEAWQEGEPE